MAADLALKVDIDTYQVIVDSPRSRAQRRWCIFSA
jgi:hypothetical protein